MAVGPEQVLLLRPFLSIKAFRDRLLADDGFMNKVSAQTSPPPPRYQPASRAARGEPSR